MTAIKIIENILLLSFLILFFAVITVTWPACTEAREQPTPAAAVHACRQAVPARLGPGASGLCTVHAFLSIRRVQRLSVCHGCISVKWLVQFRS